MTRQINSEATARAKPSAPARLLGALLAVGLLCAVITSSALARTISLNESATLHRTSHHGITINEVGNATGTIKGTIYIHLSVSSTNRVSAEINIYPSKGSITGYANASYRTQGGTATFSGAMSINRGTGTYNHAHGSGLKFSGTINRANDVVKVRLSGPMTV
jgi:hypothetical protein